MSSLVSGRVTVHPRGFGFLVVSDPDETSAFIAPPDLNVLLDGDVVTAHLSTDDAGRTSARDLTLQARSRTELFGSVTIRGKRTFLRVDRLVSNTDWPLEGAGDAAEGTHVVASIRGATAVWQRTVAADADLGVERCIARHDIRSVFPEAVLAAAKKAAKSAISKPRRDLRDLPTVTIDAASTTDIDDALAVIPAGPDGALRVLVSIADVDALVPEDSPVDEEARSRGTSVYLAGRVLPMLPDVLSGGALSLVEGADRPALTVEMRIDPEGRVTSVDLSETLIRSHARLTYDAVEELFSEGKSDDVPAAVEETLRWLRTAAARLSAVRAARGGVDLAREEAYVSLDTETREPISIAPRTESEAHRLIERLMVAANEAVAQWLVDRGLPGVFRVHDEPTPERVQMLAEFAHNFGIEAGFGPRLTPRGLAAFEAQFRGAKVAPAIRTVVGRTLGPARYSGEGGMHFGLGAPLYLHFTSPIRRYADLAVHRILKSYLRGDRAFVATRFAIEALASDLSEKAYRASKAEAERHRMLVARLFSGRIGERVSGNIVAVKTFGLVVQMIGMGATGTIATEALPDGPYRIELAAQALAGKKRRYSLGDRVEAVVTGANEELGRVDLALVEEAAS